jgi:succinate-semialdehyde dehydrogenase / glutarate-semialdehyde dehydrogenase
MVTDLASSPAAASAADIVVTNPATGETVGTLSSASPDAVAEAVARARVAQRAWGAASFRERAAVLSRFHDLLLDQAERVMDTIQKDTGKARRDALSEVVTVAGTTRYYLAHGKRHLRDRRARPAVLGITSARVVHKPLGVVGLITPWNFPFLLPVGDAIAALLAGNAVVIKPSELTPFPAELGRELLLEAGLPADLFQLVHGFGAVGQELIRHVDFIGFTGSSAVGKKVMAAAAERLIPVSLELGGKNPLIVLADAPFDDAIKGLLSGAFANSGQTCIAIERAFVERPLYDRFVTEAVKRTEAMKVGWSLGFDVDMGSLVSAQHAAKVRAHVAGAVAEGARVLTGGASPAGQPETFFRPTILTGVTDDMRIASEETFGPVVAIEPVDSAEEAVERANRTRYGLNASVWSGDTQRAFEIARRIETGSAGVNSTLLIYNSFDVPMGGVKESGLGRRHGEHGILRYTQEQSLVRSVATAGGYEAILAAMTSAKRARGLLGLFRIWRRVPFIR